MKTTHNFDGKLQSSPFRENLRGFLFFILCSFFFTSCVEDIVLPIQNGQKLLVVEGSLTTDTMAHQIKLSLSSDFYSQEPPIPVTGATVIITEGSNSWTLTEIPNTGIYETSPDFFAIPYKTYRLDITNVDIADGADYYWAKSSCYLINPIDSIQIKDHFWNPEDRLTIYIFMKDDADIENFYMGTFSVNDKLVTDSINQHFFMDDMLFNGNYIDGRFPIFSIYKDGASDKEKVLKDGDNVTVHAYGIPKDYFNFIGDLRSAGSSNPFMGPPANPRTNIFPKGKACGYFYVASVQHKSKVYYVEE